MEQKRIIEFKKRERGIKQYSQTINDVVSHTNSKLGAIESGE